MNMNMNDCYSCCYCYSCSYCFCYSCSHPSYSHSCCYCDSCSHFCVSCFDLFYGVRFPHFL